MTQPFSGYVQVQVLQSDNLLTSGCSDQVAQEIPIAFSYNGVTHAVMLATPLDLKDFALGFSLAEGIIDSAEQLFDIEIHAHRNGLELALEISGERFNTLKSKRRTLMGTTGCGLCGQESLDAFDLSLPTRLPTPSPHSPTAAGASAISPPSSRPSSFPIVAPAAVAQALSQLPRQQVLFEKTGAVHAAAWVCLQQGLTLVREDVGRHNALDKLVGALTFQGTAPDTGFVLCTSRASYEMAFKTQRFGALALVCVSAPTAKAVEIAQQSGLGLAGFARGSKMKIYANASRFGCDAG